MPPIYVGKNSHYANRFGLYVARGRGKGVSSLGKALAIAALVCFDYHRKKTVNHRDRVVRMSRKLFEKRLNFLVLLAAKHSERLERSVSRLVEFCERHRHPPSKVIESRRALRTYHVVARYLRAVNERGEEVRREVLRWLEKSARGVVRV
ncbi:MAG: hypothetical protein GXO32_05605 [Crenarchaeota archaeon]|nr:hypothetical protein [Thermoproteota archaeon]